MTKQKKIKFVVEGFALIEKKVIHYKNSASRVLVPRSWGKAILIKSEENNKKANSKA